MDGRALPAGSVDLPASIKHLVGYCNTTTHTIFVPFLTLSLPIPHHHKTDPPKAAMAFARVHTPVLLLLLSMGLLPALAASFSTPAAAGPAHRVLHPSRPGSSSPLFGPRAGAGVTGA